MSSDKVICELARATGADRAEALAPTELIEIVTDGAGKVTLKTASGAEFVAISDDEVKGRGGKFVTADALARIFVPEVQYGGRLPPNKRFLRRRVMIGGAPAVRFTEAGR